MKTSLQSLPPEIRLLVLRKCLTAPAPLYVWCHHRTQVINNEVSLGCENTPNDPPLYDLDYALLQTSRQISTEAAFVLYSSNIFLFKFGPWSTLCVFIHMIGPQNSSYLRHVAKTGWSPHCTLAGPASRLEQPSYGHKHWTTRSLRIPDPELDYLAKLFHQDKPGGPYPSEELLPRERIELVDPHAKLFFMLLGKRDSPLLLTIKMCQSVLPGAVFEHNWDNYDGEGNIRDEWWPKASTMIPNIIEALKDRYTSNVPNHPGKVDIQWCASAVLEDAKATKREIEIARWDILDITTDDPLERPPLASTSNETNNEIARPPPTKGIYYIMRRKRPL